MCFSRRPYNYQKRLKKRRRNDQGGPKCDLTGKKRFRNKVRTETRTIATVTTQFWMPNLRKRKVYWDDPDGNKRVFTFNLSQSGLRTLEKVGLEKMAKKMNIDLLSLPYDTWPISRDQQRKIDKQKAEEAERLRLATRIKDLKIPGYKLKNLLAMSEEQREECLALFWHKYGRFPERKHYKERAKMEEAYFEKWGHPGMLPVETPNNDNVLERVKLEDLPLHPKVQQMLDNPEFLEIASKNLMWRTFMSKKQQRRIRFLRQRDRHARKMAKKKYPRQPWKWPKLASAQGYFKKKPWMLKVDTSGASKHNSYEELVAKFETQGRVYVKDDNDVVRGEVLSKFSEDA